MRRFAGILASVGIAAAIGWQAASSQPFQDAPDAEAASAPRRVDLVPPRAGAGSRLQHSLRLLAGLKCDGARPVRVLFYGQSITQQDWWKTLARGLRDDYPGVPMVIENRAIGGHSAERLVKTAEADLYAFQPDLVVFHVYGNERDYERIIEQIRRKTTADILIATNHLVDDAQLTESIDRKELTLWRWTKWLKPVWASHPDAGWEGWWNSVFLPRIADRYGAELVDVRAGWKDYLRNHRLHARDLLADQIHLNAQGKALMAAIVQPYLMRARLRETACSDDRIKLYVAGRDFAPAAAGINLPFEGNRAELVGKPAAGAIEVKIDGRAPSQFAEAYQFTRTSSYPGTAWPALLTLHPGPALPADETWTATIRPADDKLSRFDFQVRGSSTGEDGSGTAGSRFVSRSCRLVIEPDDWNLAYARSVSPAAPPKELKVTWRVVPPGLDEMPPRTPLADGVDAVHDIANGHHLLQLSGPGVVSVEAIRVYRPPLQ